MPRVVVRLDDFILQELDRVARAVPVRPSGLRRRPRRARPWMSRAELVRIALHEFIGRLQRLEREERDRRAFARHRERLAKEAAALVRQQAKP